MAPPPAKRRCPTTHDENKTCDSEPEGGASRGSTGGPGLSGIEDAHIPTQSGTTARPLQTILSRFSAELRARYAEYPLPHHSNPQCRKWMSNISKEYIHPDIISKEEQEEQPDSHKEAILRGQRWRITKKGSGTHVQLEELLQTSSGEHCKVVLVEGGPGMGIRVLCHGRCVTAGEEESSLTSTRQ